MSEMRVYEAARKLNMSVDEAIGLLAGKGVDVKSPISVISQEQFEEILDSFTRQPQAAPAKTQESAEPAPEAPAEKERGRLTLVTPITAAKQAQEAQPAHEADEDEDAPPSKPAEQAEPVPPAREPLAASHETKGGDFTKTMSYTAAGLSIAALLAVIALAVTAVRNAKEVSALTATVQTNQSALNDTRNALSDLKSRVEINRRLQARAGLSERSATLDELAVTMPGPNGDRLRRLAASLNALTSGM